MPLLGMFGIFSAMVQFDNDGISLGVVFKGSLSMSVRMAPKDDAKVVEGVRKFIS